MVARVTHELMRNVLMKNLTKEFTQITLFSRIRIRCQQQCRTFITDRVERWRGNRLSFILLFIENAFRLTIYMEYIGNGYSPSPLSHTIVPHVLLLLLLSSFSTRSFIKLRFIYHPVSVTSDSRSFEHNSVCAVRFASLASLSPLRGTDMQTVYWCNCRIDQLLWVHLSFFFLISLLPQQSFTRHISLAEKLRACIHNVRSIFYGRFAVAVNVCVRVCLTCIKPYWYLINIIYAIKLT